MNNSISVELLLDNIENEIDSNQSELVSKISQRDALTKELQSIRYRITKLNKDKEIIISTLNGVTQNES